MPKYEEIKPEITYMLSGNQFDGTIELRQHVLTIAPTGRIKAQVVAQSVVVLGKANGSIRASEKVSIGKTGSVEGTISAPRVVVADGAHLQGRVDM